MTRGTWVRAGIVVTALAVVGWLITTVALSFVAQPSGTEDLTAAWKASGPTALGRDVTVTVAPGSTLVAFLVGTDLRRPAGTTAGSCLASAAGQDLPLDWPVHVNPSLDGVLTERQQVVAVAGWTNHSAAPADIRIRCRSADSTVDHFVAVPSRTARLETRPWFQPWGWLSLGVLGVSVAALGLKLT